EDAAFECDRLAIVPCPHAARGHRDVVAVGEPEDLRDLLGVRGPDDDVRDGQGQVLPEDRGELVAVVGEPLALGGIDRHAFLADDRSQHSFNIHRLGHVLPSSVGVVGPCVVARIFAISSRTCLTIRSNRERPCPALAAEGSPMTPFDVRSVVLHAKCGASPRPRERSSGERACRICWTEGMARALTRSGCRRRRREVSIAPACISTSPAHRPGRRLRGRRKKVLTPWRTRTSRAQAWSTGTLPPCPLSMATWPAPC